MAALMLGGIAAARRGVVRMLMCGAVIVRCAIARAVVVAVRCVLDGGRSRFGVRGARDRVQHRRHSLHGNDQEQRDEHAAMKSTVEATEKGEHARSLREAAGSGQVEDRTHRSIVRATAP